MKLISLFFLVFFFSTKEPFAQIESKDIFDFENSEKFAKYLMNSGQFEFAAEEYERLVFMKPESIFFKIELLKALRKDGNFDKAASRWHHFSGEQSVFNRELNEEFYKNLLFSNEPEEAKKYLLKSGFLTNEFLSRATVYTSALLLENPSEKYFQSIPNPEKFQTFFAKAKKRKKKNPAVASVLSGIIPGAGKAYSGQWKDGLISLIFVGVNAWQAQRRFSKEGVESFWGWFHASVGTGFYIGNIYGSHKAARRFNQKQISILKHEAETLVFPLLD